MSEISLALEFRREEDLYANRKQFLYVLEIVIFPSFIAQYFRQYLVLYGQEDDLMDILPANALIRDRSNSLDDELPPSYSNSSMISWPWPMDGSQRDTDMSVVIATNLYLAATLNYLERKEDILY